VKRKEVAVKNQPGIYKVLVFDEAKNKWIDTGTYRAMRRIVRDGKSIKEQAKFSSFEDAKRYRLGLLEKAVSNGVHRTEIESEDGLTFGKLIEEWKAFHFLQIDYATKQTYEKRIPHLESLFNVPVSKFDPKLIDKLVTYWVKDYPKAKRRFTFDKELDLMKVVLNFYRRRRDPRFVIPIFDEHYKAAHIKKDAVQPVRALSQKDLGLFFQALRDQKNPIYYPLALTQFCLGLRIGEACGLHWRDVDLETGTAKIESTIVWDHENWEPRIKSRPKNGRARFLAMPETLVTELTKLKRLKSPKTDLVFHADGSPLIRKSVGQAYNRALALIGVDYVSGTHLLRKTAATQANRVTGDFYAVSRLLDHATPDVTMRYVEELDDQKRKVATALEGVMQSLIGDGKQS
jgi:integrase